tara:strand:- start:15758 stop:17131 length:1374 start_codon:yes stop_codon:yes gene_type:complete
MENKKTFIIDTSVLLYDKNSITSFEDNILVIPLIVLDELDRFKGKTTLVGENARYINRYLDDLRKKGNLSEGIEIENGQIIKVDVSEPCAPPSLDPDVADNKIIGLAMTLKASLIDKGMRVIVVTKDINFRVKCDALGLEAEDYNSDNILEEKSKQFMGHVVIQTEYVSLVDDLFQYNLHERDHKDEIIESVIEMFEETFNRKPFENEYFNLKCGKSSFLGRYTKKDIKRVRGKSHKGVGLLKEFKDLKIEPRNKEQRYALDALLDENIPLVTITGLAGSGKTFLAIMAAHAMVEAGIYDRIVFTRNVQPVGREMGFLPGSIDDKMEPWLAPIMDNFRVGLGDNHASYFKTLVEKGIFEISPLSYIRGRTFNKTILIMDEAQNATIHELKTVGTRIGEKSKIILMGDIDQIDTPYINELSNGLTIVAEKLKNQSVAAHVALKKGERSKLSSVLANLL